MKSDGGSVSVAQLERAIKEHARADARHWVDVVASSQHTAEGAIDGDTAVSLMKLLLEKRWFEAARTLGRALRRQEDRSAVFLKQYAQALIEEREYTQALDLLETVDRRPDLTSEQRAEIRGLIGRTYKQIEMDQQRLQSFRQHNSFERAIQTYLAEYRAAPAKRTWHGINAVALLSLAKRDQRPEGAIADPLELARSIVRVLDENPDETDVWRLPTYAEAYVALGEMERAAEYTEAFAQHRKVNAFHLGSTLRQFTELWQLDKSDSILARGIVAVLRARQLELEYGQIRLTPEQLRESISDSPGMRDEKVFAGSMITRKSLLLGLERCSAVACISRDVDRGLGTGFLIPGKLLRESYGESLVLVTNHHVVDSAGKEGLRPEEVDVCFHAIEGVDCAEPFHITEVLWESSRTQLDCTVARLDRTAPSTSSFPIARVLPSSEGDARVYVIGHPGGGVLSFSLDDNKFLGHDERRLHYRTPTEGGSSGSPVFNTKWELIGLHHAGGNALSRLDGEVGTYEANEGLSILAIRAAINA